MSAESAPKPAPAASVQELERFLGHVGGLLRRAAAFEGLVVIVTGVVAAVALGALASLLGRSTSTIALTEGAVAAAVLAFVVLRYGRLVSGALDAPRAVATWLDRAIQTRGLGGRERIALLSAVELSADRGRFGESELLGDAAIARARDSALAIDSRALVKKEAWSSLRYRLATLGAVTAAVVLFGILGPKHLSHALSAMAAIGRLDNPLSPALPEPRLGDFRITYRYPAYSERSPRVVVDASGDVRALPGTEVTIETNARETLTQGTILLTYGDPASAERSSEGEAKTADSTRLALEVQGRHIEASFIVSRAGRYRISVKSEDGELFEERRGHAIELELDEPPEITQLEPEESPLEVNEHDRLNLGFEATDDFGLGEIYFAWRVIGSAREGKEKLTSAGRGQRHYAGNAQLDLAPLQLAPGDRVAYTLEARDNDTVNGPKIGAGMTRELRVYSKATHHQQVLALQEQALDELVHILGDNLDSLFDFKGESEAYKALLDAADRVVERAMKADELLRKTVAAVKKDPMGRPAVADAFEAARTQLGRDARRKRTTLVSARRQFAARRAPEKEPARQVRGTQDTMVASLEKNVVYLADLLNEQYMIDAEALAKELRAQQQALKKALEEYKASPDPEKRKQLAQAIQEIKQRITEIMQQLAKMRGSIPTDFVNPDAMEARDSQAAMEEIARRIEDGDLDGAMNELDRMLNQTEQMMSELQGGREELGSREYSEITENARKLWDDLQETERQQRELAQRTEKISKEVLERMKQRLGDPASFVEKQKKRLEQAAQALERARPGSHFTEGDLHDQAARRVDDGMKALEARDFGAAREMIESGSEQVEQLEQDAHRRAEQARRFGDLFGGGRSAERAERELRRALPILDEVLKDIEKLMPPPESLLTPEERQQLARNAQRQEELRKNAEQLGEDLEKLGQELPIVGPEMKGMISEAAGAMGSAGRNLDGGDAPSALNQQRRAIDALQRLEQELEKMSEQGQGGSGPGVPLPFGQPQNPGSRDGEGQSNQRLSVEKVEIPKPEQYKPPAEFREDILEAAKQGTVEDYREAVRRYYEELVK